MADANGVNIKEWQARMQDTNDYGESAYALALIIEQGAVCEPCRKGNHEGCTGIGTDVYQNKPIDCQCQVPRSQP